MSNESWNSFQKEYGKSGRKTKLLGDLGLVRADSGRHLTTTVVSAAAVITPDITRSLKRGGSNPKHMSGAVLQAKRSGLTRSGSNPSLMLNNGGGGVTRGVRRHRSMKGARSGSSSNLLAGLTRSRNSNNSLSGSSSSGLSFK
ncbi:expressed unknown protein [Seminavis robusta]|uniref:Uncharacterized protein n=1 Tax=Seminavis robusta TaxID=568900 RepID=A0A9N8ESG1_9STRA|nr:expressed unknown protein [Seminavis robusta]|eukprot:Sro1467_g275120.1 n/a (143) ;mRNA; r:14363-14791